MSSLRHLEVKPVTIWIGSWTIEESVDNKNNPRRNFISIVYSENNVDLAGVFKKIPQKVLNPRYIWQYSTKIETRRPASTGVFFSRIQKAHHWFLYYMQKTSLENFCLSTEKIRCGTLRCFRKFRVSKNFMHRGVHQGLLEFFFVSQCQKVSWGTLQCFRKFGVSKNSMYNKGVITIFHRKFLVSQCRKTSRGNPFVFQKISGMEKIMDKRGGGITFFSAEFFLSHSAEKHRGGTLLCFRNVLVSKIFMHRGGGGGGHQGFLENFLSHSAKKFVGNLSMFPKSWGIEKFYA